MTEEEKQFNQWFDEYADGVKVFEEADMKQAYLQGRADLEKENAELKEQIKTLQQIKREHTDYTIKVEEERTFVKDQLTKAKEILEKLLLVSCNSDVLNQYPNCSEVLQARNEAEQFMSEVGK